MTNDWFPYHNSFTTANKSVWNFTTVAINPSVLCVKRLAENAKLPTRANAGDLGFDLYALERTIIQPGVVTKVRTGIAVQFPMGYGGLIRDRSSVATKAEVFTVAGVIDNGYTGEIIVAFYNPGELELWSDQYSSPVIPTEIVHTSPHVFEPGDKIAQLVLMPVFSGYVVEVTNLADTQRGEKGFGSSGK